MPGAAAHPNPMPPRGPRLPQHPRRLPLGRGAERPRGLGSTHMGCSPFSPPLSMSQSSVNPGSRSLKDPGTREGRWLPPAAWPCHPHPHGTSCGRSSSHRAPWGLEGLWAKPSQTLEKLSGRGAEAVLAQPPSNEQPSLQPMCRAARLCLEAGGPSEGCDPSTCCMAREGHAGWALELMPPGPRPLCMIPDPRDRASSLAQVPACSPRGQVGFPRPLVR